MEEYQRLISSFLIKVTEFMRDQELFNTLQRDIIPALVQRAEATRAEELRIWSAGCATGEEAYSLAILVSEVMEEKLERFNIKIFATDLDADAVNFARRGFYPASALESMPNRLVKRYFIEHEGAYEVSRIVRRLVIFGEHDLAQRAPFPQIDMVVCRNVLIYFTKELQQRTLRLFAFSLRNDGYLVLGKAETVSPMSEYFVTDQPILKIYRRRGERLLIPPPLDINLPHRITQHGSRQPRQRIISELSRVQQELQRTRGTTETLLLNLPIGVVMVDPNYDIQEINSAARRLLGIYSSAIGQDFVHLAHTLPSRPLLQAINQAIRENQSQQLEEVAVENANSGQRIYLQITCYPHEFKERDQTLRFALILINDITVLVNDRHGLVEVKNQQAELVAELEQTVIKLRQVNADLESSNARLQEANAELDKARQQAVDEMGRIAQTVERLMMTNRELVKANEDLASANQELRAINDEFLMTSEEAQAATEELETLNEETQATNEEMETLNEELQGTIEELNTTNSDLVNQNDMLQEQLSALEADQQAREQERAVLAAIVASFGEAVLVVAADGTLQLTNPAFDTLLHLDGHLEDDQGQPLPPEDMPQARAARGEPFTMTVAMRTNNGITRYEARGLPLPEGAGGVVIFRRSE